MVFLATFVLYGQLVAPSQDLLQYAVPGKLFLARIMDGKEDPAKINPDTPLLKRLGLTGSFDETNAAGLVWDSSKLFPIFVLSGGDKQSLRSSEAMRELFTDPHLKGQIWFQDSNHSPDGQNNGLRFADHPGLARLAIQGSGLESSGITEFSDSAMTVRLDPFVRFRSRDGRSEVFGIKPSRLGGTLTGIPSDKPLDLHPRVPVALRKVLSKISFPNGGSEVCKVGDLTAKLAELSGETLLADRRIESDSLLVKLPDKRLSCLDVALAVADAMDMYWRKVGDTYLLAISPEDPRFLAREKFDASIETKLTPVLEEMVREGMLPRGLPASALRTAGWPASEFAPSFFSGLPDQLSTNSPLERQKLSDVLADPEFQMGTIQFVATGGPDFESKIGHVQAGGMSFYFGGS